LTNLILGIYHVLSTPDLSDDAGLLRDGPDLAALPAAGDDRRGLFAAGAPPRPDLLAAHLYPVGQPGEHSHLSLPEPGGGGRSGHLLFRHAVPAALPGAWPPNGAGRQRGRGLDPSGLVYLSSPQDTLWLVFASPGGTGDPGGEPPGPPGQGIGNRGARTYPAAVGGPGSLSPLPSLPPGA